MVLFSGRSSSLETFIELPHSVSQDEKAGIFPSHPPWFPPVNPEGFLPAKKLKNKPQVLKGERGKMGPWTENSETSQMKAKK